MRLLFLKDIKWWFICARHASRAGFVGINSLVSLYWPNRLKLDPSLNSKLFYSLSLLASPGSSHFKLCILKQSIYISMYAYVTVCVYLCLSHISICCHTPCVIHLSHIIMKYLTQWLAERKSWFKFMDLEFTFQNCRHIVSRSKVGLPDGNRAVSVCEQSACPWLRSQRERGAKVMQSILSICS